jgi:hypothetical protein
MLRSAAEGDGSKYSEFWKISQISQGKNEGKRGRRRRRDRNTLVIK